MAYGNLWDTVKLIYGCRYALKAYIKKEEVLKFNDQRSYYKNIEKR